MTTEYLQYTCKTCRDICYTQAANAPTQKEKRLLRCATGHQNTYGPEEIESLPLEATQEIRDKIGLSS